MSREMTFFALRSYSFFSVAMNRQKKYFTDLTNLQHIALIPDFS